jgi:hypothetical protein
LSRIDVDKEERQAAVARSCLVVAIKVGVIFIIWAITVYIAFCFLVWR